MAAACAAIASSAFAQGAPGAQETAPSSLKTLTVTANKIEERLQDVPQSVTLITADELQQRSIRNMGDLVREVPNLSSSFLYSNDLNFRGINSSTFTNANPLVMYVDGVPQSNRIAYDALLENVDRVEILRGPQGSLYGKDAIGGVINIITRISSLRSGRSTAAWAWCVPPMTAMPPRPAAAATSPVATGSRRLQPTRPHWGCNIWPPAVSTPVAMCVDRDAATSTPTTPGKTPPMPPST